MLSNFVRRVRYHVAKRARRLSGRFRGVAIVRGIKIPIGDHLSPLLRDVLYRGEYEGKELDVLSAHLRPGDVVLELGGGLGFLSAFSSKKIGSENVFVYEANPELEAPIRRLYALNGVHPRLTFCALGPVAGVMTFHVGRDFWESSNIAENVSNPKNRLEVPVRAFADELQMLPRNPNFLVIDIEGGEYELLPKVPLDSFKKILCEVHAGAGSERNTSLLASLAARGFRLDESASSGNLWFLEKR